MKTKHIIQCACVLSCVALKTLAGFEKSPAFTLKITAPVYAAMGDLNHDGKPDIAVSVRVPGKNWSAARQKDHVDIFYQEYGTFKMPSDMSLDIVYASGIQIGDFDGDGTNDLVILSNDSPLHIFPGSRNLKEDYTQHSPNAARSGPIACRLNKRGLHDFLCGPVWFKWLRGSRITQGYIYGPEINDNIHSQPADLDLDNMLDLLVTRKGRQTIRLYYGPVLSMKIITQEMSQYTELPVPMTFGNGLAVGDFNDDGRPDILAASSDRQQTAERNIFFFYQNAPMGFTTNVPPRRLNGLTGMMAVGDINRDGLDDLAVAGGKIYVFLQKKGQHFAENASGADQIIDPGGNYKGITLVDFNTDGYPDIIVWDREKAVRGYANKGKTP